jgi:hypothetical protein
MKSNLAIHPTKSVGLSVLTQQNTSGLNPAQGFTATAHALLSLLMLKSSF